VFAMGGDPLESAVVFIVVSAIFTRQASRAKNRCDDDISMFMMAIAIVMKTD